MKKVTLIGVVLLGFGTSYSQDILAKHVFEAEGVDEVVIVGKFCEVFVSESDKVQFSGIIEGKGKQGDFEINSAMSGRKLQIEVTKSLESPWSKLSKAQFQISVPDGTKIHVENSSGDVTIRDLRSSLFEIRTTSGDSKLIGITGPTVVNSTSGNQYLYSIIGEVTLESTSGNQEINQVAGNIRSRATSGDMEFSRIDGNLFCETTSGNVSIRDFVGALNLQSTSGDISGSQIAVTNPSYFKASSGDIQIRFKDGLDKYYFDIQSTSGFLRIGEMYGEKNLRSTTKGVEILGITTSGDQYYTN